jgi:hypothetical protein
MDLGKVDESYSLHNETKHRPVFSICECDTCQVDAHDQLKSVHYHSNTRLVEACTELDLNPFWILWSKTYLTLKLDTVYFPQKLLLVL